MAVSSEEFRAALSRFASGVTVVTSVDGEGRRHGITVSAFCSVSLEPPLVLVCIDKLAGSHASLECEVRQEVDAGDHSVFIGEVMSARGNGGDPLLYFLGDYRSLDLG